MSRGKERCRWSDSWREGRRIFHVGMSDPPPLIPQFGKLCLLFFFLCESMSKSMQPLSMLEILLGLSKPMVTLPPLSANTSLIRGKDLSCTRVFQQQVQKLVFKQGLDHKMLIRVSQKKLFFDLSLYLLTTHAIGLEEPTKFFSALKTVKWHRGKDLKKMAFLHSKNKAKICKYP